MKAKPEMKQQQAAARPHPNQPNRRRGLGPADIGQGREEPRINTLPRIPPRLDIAPADSPAEREADRAAEQMLHGGKADTARTEQPGRLHRKADTPQGGTTAPAYVASQIAGARGNGGGLYHSLRQKLAHTFDADFSHVKVHDDPKSHALSAQLQAKAFTVGNDMFFAKGQYAPGTPEGDRLIAHEAAHVVQGGEVLRRKEENDALNALNRDQCKTYIGHFRDSGLMRATIEADIHLRSIEGWRDFLINEASGSKGAAELMGFMSISCGEEIRGQLGVTSYEGLYPTKWEATDLMIAMLTTPELDLDNNPWSSFDIWGAGILANFVRTFISSAIIRLTGTSRNLYNITKLHQNSISKLIDQGDSPIVGQYMFAPLLATAITAANGYLILGADSFIRESFTQKDKSVDEEGYGATMSEKNRLRFIVLNSARSISAAIAGMDSLRQKNNILRNLILDQAIGLLPSVLNVSTFKMLGETMQTKTTSKPIDIRRGRVGQDPVSKSSLDAESIGIGPAQDLITKFTDGMLGSYVGANVSEFLEFSEDNIPDLSRSFADAINCTHALMLVHKSYRMRVSSDTPQTLINAFALGVTEKI